MIEQTITNGRLYKTVVKEDKNGKQRLITKEIRVDDVTFHPYTSIAFLIKQDDAPGIYYYTYNNYTYRVSPDNIAEVAPGALTITDTYYVGLAEHNDEFHQYVIKNEPPVTGIQPLTTIPEPPTSKIGFKYNQFFNLPVDFIVNMGNIQATYIDRFKRPLNSKWFSRGDYLPLEISKVVTTLSDLNTISSRLPWAINLEGTDWCVADLEPGYTQKDLEFVRNLDIAYEEDTPNGGKHLLFKTDQKTFKWQVSNTLELINESSCTFYGINPTPFRQVGLSHIEVKEIKQIERVHNDKGTPISFSKPELYDTYIDFFIKNGIDRSNLRESIDHLYNEEMYSADPTIDNSPSKMDYKACLKVYSQLFFKIPDQYNPERHTYLWQMVCEKGFTMDDIMFLVAHLVSLLIPYRLKHDEMRGNITWLQYQARHAIHYVNNNWEHDVYESIKNYGV